MKTKYLISESDYNKIKNNTVPCTIAGNYDHLYFSVGSYGISLINPPIYSKHINDFRKLSYLEFCNIMDATKFDKN